MIITSLIALDCKKFLFLGNPKNNNEIKQRRTQKDISITVALTIFFTVLIAKATGAILPILIKKIGMDPAVMSSPLITTVVDALAIFLYLQIAILFLDIAI